MVDVIKWIELDAGGGDSSVFNISIGKSALGIAGHRKYNITIALQHIGCGVD
jgi:hypothetical protein